MTDQYVVEVTNDRGRPRFKAYKNDAAAIDTSALPVVGLGSSFSYQGTEPNGISTFTMTLTEP